MRNILALAGSFFLFISLAHGSRLEYACEGSGPSKLTIKFSVHSKQSGKDAFFQIAGLASRPNTATGSPGSLEMKWQRLIDASGGWDTKYTGHDGKYSYYSHEAKYQSLDLSVSFEIKSVILTEYDQKFNAVAEMNLPEFGSQPVSLSLACQGPR